jgi:pyocin large subunit-like protein
LSSGKYSDRAKLLDHFLRHGHDFRAKSAADYERLADAFLNGVPTVGVMERMRSNGDRVRYDPSTNEFGIAKPDGTIRTYFKPDPAVHGFPTNLDYFHAQ